MTFTVSADPFQYEVFRRLIQRDHYFTVSGQYRETDPARYRHHLAVALHENQLLEKYFPQALDSAGCRWDAAKQAHQDWWQLRIARQTEIDASIAAKADFEYLYDKPYQDKKRVRVAGPFTVESLSPHRVLGVDENDELIDQAAEAQTEEESA